MTLRSLAAVCSLLSLSFACSGAESGESNLGAQTLAQTISPLVPVENIDLESSPQPVNKAQSRTGACDQWLTSGNRTYSLYLDGSVCAYPDKPYVTTNPAFVYKGTRGLQLTVPPRINAVDADGVPCTAAALAEKTCPPGPDRAEITPHDSGYETRDGVGFNFNNPKYFGFAVKIYSPNGVVPHIAGNGVHFMQAWQYNCGRDEKHGTCGVPFHATVRDKIVRNPATDPPEPFEFYLSSHDDSPIGTGGHPVVGPPVTPGGPPTDHWPLSANEWHRFIFFLNPSSNELPGTGTVTAWLDGVQIVDWHNDWGCNLTPPSHLPPNDPPYFGVITDEWHLRVGMYRTDSGIIDQRLDLLFDNVRVASSKKQADPDVVY